MTTNDGFDSLHSHAQRLKGASIPSLLAAEPGRVQELALRVGPLYVNFARQKYDAAALQALLALAAERDVGGRHQPPDARRAGQPDRWTRGAQHGAAG
jgi:glucose-6-phosphate isomerase